LRKRALAAAALACIPVAALARGGGGGHGGGGGGGHSSGGHGGFGHSGSFGHGWFGHGAYGHGGGFFFGAALFQLFTFGITALIVFIVIRQVLRARQNMAMLSEPSDEASIALVRASALADGTTGAGAALAQMRAADPEFEPETFMQRAEMTFFLVKRAYQHRDLAAGRPLMASGLFAPWSASVQQLLTEHHRPMLESLNVRGMHVADAMHDGTHDRIAVHFDIVFRGKLFDDRDGKLLADAGDDRRAGERWTFERAAGVKTVAAGGVVAQKCPKCGAALELSSDSHCRFCGADVANGEFDWTVSSMAPAQFDGVALDPLLDQVEMPPEAGLAAIHAADPAFDEAAFLARVQQAFLALQTAWEARQVDTARGFMSPGLYFSWSAQVEQMTEDHRKNILEGMRVDRVTPVRVLHGRVFDDVTVRVDATCADYEVDETTGKVVFGDRTPRSFAEFWTFQRGVGAKTGAKGLLDKVCPNCGAPLDVTQIGECRFCKAAVTSGQFDWVLSRIEQQEEFSGVGTVRG
jgi:predicted lipid-binding transport protein (Tim44 family)